MRKPTPTVADHLAAACGTFGQILADLGACAPNAGDLTIPVAMALGAAADGRDTILTAPSLTAAPAGSAATPRQDLAAKPPETVAGTLAEEARLLATRLAVAAQATSTGSDRDALAAASRHAASVHDFLTGTGLWHPRPPENS